MTLDEKRRQKKLAKRAAKRKVQRAGKQLKSSAASGHSPAQAARFPIYACLVPDNLFELGLGNVVLSRSLPSGDLAVAGFLLDVYCLGVKNAFYLVSSPEDYALNMSRYGEDVRYERVHQSCLRKLVEGAVEYARELGFTPHPDYARAAKLFGDIEAAACPERYIYGKDGKPLYVSGPYETPAQSCRILDTLAQRLGSEGFHFMRAVDSSEHDAALETPGTLELVSYEITDEPLHDDSAYGQLPESVRDEITALYYERLANKPEEAIALLQPLIEQYPDVPRLYNYLHTAYRVLGDRAGCERVLGETLMRFPDYLFGRIAYAVECLERGEVEKVPEIFAGKYELKLLYPERERFHVSEVMSFYTVMAWYFHACGERARAETYYKLLQQLDPEHHNTLVIKRMLYPSRLRTWLREKLLPR
jgi:tetratricopeptide (TPR) repeat protein